MRPEWTGFIPDYFGGEHWQARDLWLARSPIFQAGDVSTPALIQHGEADNRVPVRQAYELYHTLERQGSPTRLVLYPRQGHNIREPKLELDAMRRNLDWFDRWIGEVDGR